MCASFAHLKKCASDFFACFSNLFSQIKYFLFSMLVMRLCMCEASTAGLDLRSEMPFTSFSFLFKCIVFSASLNLVGKLTFKISAIGC